MDFGSASRVKSQVRDFPAASGGLYTLADILTSINKKQSKANPNPPRKKSSYEDDAPNTLEWKEYQAKRLQAIKILKQEKESRLREEMKRLGLKSITPELRARLEAQFQYLHETLLPDAGLEEDQAAAAKANRLQKKNAKKSSSVHWSKDVVDSDDKTKKNKSSIKASASISTSTTKSSRRIKASGKSPVRVTKSFSTTRTKNKKDIAKTLPDLVSAATAKWRPVPSLGSKLTNLLTTEKTEKEKRDDAATSVLQEYKYQPYPVESSTMDLVEDSPPYRISPRSSSATHQDTFTRYNTKKSGFKATAAKLKSPSNSTITGGLKPKSKTRSLVKVKNNRSRSKSNIQSSGYGPKGKRSKSKSSLKKAESMKNSASVPEIASGGKSNTALLKKAAAQQNALAGMKKVLKNPLNKVVRTKSEVETLTKTSRAAPIVKTNAMSPTIASRSKSVSNTGKVTRATTHTNVMPAATGAGANKNKLDLPLVHKSVSEISKSVLLMGAPLPHVTTTTIAELYPVNSRIAAAVDSFIERETNKQNILLETDAIAASIAPVEKPESTAAEGDTTKDSVSTDTKPIEPPSLYKRTAQKKPPKFPTVDLCNVFPGTHEWDRYWEKFNGQITSYYSEMDEYLKTMNDFTMDLEDYSKELRKIQLGNQAFAMKLGMNPNYKSSPNITPKNGSSAQFFNTPLEPGIYNLNGYIIKSGGTRIPGLKLTTLGNNGFSLELDLVEIDIDPQLITVETEYNVMTLTVPPKLENGKVRTIQIGVPTRSNVSDLNLKDLQKSSKVGGKSRTLVITGH